MHRIASSPGLLLLVTGSLIGLNFPLGKIAGAGGVSPVIWAMVVSFGAAGMLLPILLITRRLKLPTAELARYAVLSGLLSFVIANILVFAAIPQVGAGYVGLMFALSPVFTLAFSAVFGIARTGRLGLVGIAFGLAGAATVAATRGHGLTDVAPIWGAVAVLIPVTLAVGNVYRTLAWPKGADPDQLAFFSHAVAVVIYGLISLVLYRAIPLQTLSNVPAATAVQMLAAALTFPAYFRLQRLGGPVMLSQIGYVAAAVGLVIATLILGETYPPATWVGAGMIALGIALTLVASRPSRTVPASPEPSSAVSNG